MFEYSNFTECYLALADSIYNDPDFVSSPRNMKVREKLGVKFVIKNPRARIPYVPARKFSIHYMIAELLWYLSGDNSTEWISNYSSFWKKISDDGKTANSAYGARIFKPHNRIGGGQFIQWDYIKKELQNDPDSRRAVLHIRSPWDSTHAKLDVPCTLALQFFIRDGKLHQIVHMRSSDLILGIAYDIPAFTFFQELLALQLGVGLGDYIHISNSLHIYERHFDMVKTMIDPSQREEAIMLQISRGAMPRLCDDPPVHELMSLENELRKASTENTVLNLLDELTIINRTDLNYWNDWGKVLTSHRLKKMGLLRESNKILNTTSFAGYQIGVGR